MQEKSKMVFVLAENSRDFVRSRPPTVIFFLCLVVMTATMFSFTYFIRNSDKVVNSDIKKNWISLTKQLNDMELCATNVRRAVWNEVSFSITLQVNFTEYQFGGSQIEVYYNLTGWQPNCGSQHNYVKVNFLAPSTNETTVCAVMTGSRDLLPGNSNDTCASYESTENTTVILHSGENCSGTNSDPLKLFFDKTEDFVVYLTENDKRVIYVHLLWISFILLFFVLIMLIYIMNYQSATLDYQPTVTYKHSKNEDPRL